MLIGMDGVLRVAGRCSPSLAPLRLHRPPFQLAASACISKRRTTYTWQLSAGSDHCTNTLLLRGTSKWACTTNTPRSAVQTRIIRAFIPVPAFLLSVRMLSLSFSLPACPRDLPSRCRVARSACPRSMLSLLSLGPLGFASMSGGGGPGDHPEGVCICGYYPLFMDTPQMSGSNAAGSGMCHTFFGQDYFMPMDGTHPSSGDYSCPTGAPYADVTDSVGNAAMCHNQGTMCGGTGGDHGGHAGGNHGGHAGDYNGR